MQSLNKILTVLATTRVMFLSLVALMALATFISTAYFKIKSNEIVKDNTTNQNGDVAGTQTINNEQLPNDLPIMPNTEILSIDKSNKDTYILLESQDIDRSIRDYYDQHFIQNGWKKSGNTYTLKKQKVTIDINNSIIKITTNY